MRWHHVWFHILWKLKNQQWEESLNKKWRKKVCAFQRLGKKRNKLEKNKNAHTHAHTHKTKSCNSLRVKGYRISVISQGRHALTLMQTHAIGWGNMETHSRPMTSNTRLWGCDWDHVKRVTQLLLKRNQIALALQDGEYFGWSLKFSCNLVFNRATRQPMRHKRKKTKTGRQCPVWSMALKVLHQIETIMLQQKGWEFRCYINVTGLKGTTLEHTPLKDANSMSVGMYSSANSREYIYLSPCKVLMSVYNTVPQCHSDL